MADYVYQALSLSCTDKGFIHIPCTNPKLFDVSGEFTLELWVKVPVFQTEKMLLSQKDSFSLSLCDKNLVFSTAEGTKVTGIGAELYENTWHSIVVIVYQNDIRIIVDGVLCIEAALPDNRGNMEPITIGGGFFGNIRWVRIYDSALMESEVAQYIYNSDQTDNMAVYCDFTCNPPKEKISGKDITLPESMKIVRAMPAAKFGEGKYFAAGEKGRVNPAGKILDAYSVQVWCMPEAPTDNTYYTIFSNSGENVNAGVEIALRKENDSYRVVVVHKSFNAADNTLTSVSVVKKHCWCNIAVTFDGDVLILYINGKEDCRVDGLKSKQGVLEKNSVTIGAHYDRGSEMATSCFHGLISRVDVWEKCLSDSQVSVYMNAEPFFDDEKIAAIWSFFDSIPINMVTGRQLLGVGGIICDWYEAPITEVCSELHTPYCLMTDEVEPLTAEELHECRMKSGILSTDVECSAMTSIFEKDQTVYIVIHTPERSFTATMLEGREADWDELTLWKIELVVLILNAVAMYLFSQNVTYTRNLGGRIYTQLVNNGQFTNIVGNLNAATAESAVGIVIQILSLMISKDIMWDLLRTCLNHLSLWSILTGIAYLALKSTSLPASFALMLAMLSASIVVHLTKLARILCMIQVNEIYFIHNKPGAICGINIRKNEMDAWFCPEWTANRIESAPVVYRLARFGNDPLQIKVNFTRSNIAKYGTVRIRATAYGENEDFLGDIPEETITFSTGRTKSNDVFFTISDGIIRNAGIQKKEVHWRWEYFDTDRGQWIQSTCTTHTVYTILDSVHAPWGRSRTGSPRIDVPWTDVYDWTIDSVRGSKSVKEVMDNLTDAMYNDPKYLYSGFCLYVGYTGGATLRLQNMVNNYFSLTGNEQMNIECSECAALLVAQANIYGCDMRLFQMLPKTGVKFELNAIRPIGELAFRQPGGTFAYHCAATTSVSAADLTTMKIYDSCIQYYSATPQKEIVLAKGVKCAQTRVLPVDRYTVLQDTYIEGWIANKQEGIGNVKICDPQQVYMGDFVEWLSDD